MKLTAVAVPFTLQAKGGIDLVDETGDKVFHFQFLGYFFPVDKAVNDALATAMIAVLNAEKVPFNAVPPPALPAPSSD